MPPLPIPLSALQVQPLPHPQAPEPSVLPAVLPSRSKLGSTRPLPSPHVLQVTLHLGVRLLPFALSPVWSPCCPMSVPQAMSSACTHSRCRGAPCPHHLISHLPFLLCSAPQNMSLKTPTSIPSLSSFLLPPSSLPPCLPRPRPCGSGHPVPVSTLTLPLSWS